MSNKAKLPTIHGVSPDDRATGEAVGYETVVRWLDI
jgi:hypothetical protein